MYLQANMSTNLQWAMLTAIFELLTIVLFLEIYTNKSLIIKLFEIYTNIH